MMKKTTMPKAVKPHLPAQGKHAPNKPHLRARHLSTSGKSAFAPPPDAGGPPMAFPPDPGGAAMGPPPDAGAPPAALGGAPDGAPPGGGMPGM